MKRLSLAEVTYEAINGIPALWGLANGLYSVLCDVQGTALGIGQNCGGLFFLQIPG